MVVLWFDTVFPPRLIATSCIFIFLGGGAPVLIGILFSMVSDVIPGEERFVPLARRYYFMTGLTRRTELLLSCRYMLVALRVAYSLLH